MRSDDSDAAPRLDARRGPAEEHAGSAPGPKISVVMVTYNHERFIARALDSVLSQEHDYSYEILVGDDASTDGTESIVSAYAQEHPDIIRLISHATNVGQSRNYLCLLEACRGEYVAFLDGDDYWTDPKKLSTQIQFLDDNPDFVLSCHRFRQHFVPENRFEEDLYPKLYEKNPEGFVMDPDRFFSHWLTQTLTVVCRRSAVQVAEFRNYEHFTDTHIFWTVLHRGKGYAHGFFGGVYNRHEAGLWSKLDRYEQFEFNFEIMSDLMRTYSECPPLRRAYVIHGRMLLWIHSLRLLAHLDSLRSVARIASMLFEIAVSFVPGGRGGFRSRRPSIPPQEVAPQVGRRASLR